MTMLIINADDWGKNKLATDRSLSCFANRRITSASAMIFMPDSERSAELALENHIDVGLHINFTQGFSGRIKSAKLIEYHQRISHFLLKNKYHFLLYNPALKNHFEYVYNAQFEEFVRLYNRNPSHIDGHHHMHLCMNMIIDKIIPKGFKIRRNFYFFPHEKNLFNRFYRHVIDTLLIRRYICVDYFFSIPPICQIAQLRKILNLTKFYNVEIEVHPERREEYNFLMSDEYLKLISNIETDSYVSI